MRLLILASFFIFGASAAPKSHLSKKLDLASECIDRVCSPPDCRCSTTDIPGGLQPDETPQFVLLTFDDSVTVDNIDYYRSAAYNKYNPNGCPIGLTFYVSHDWSDYSLVNELYSKGQEIATHTISHKYPQTDWLTMSLEELVQEIGGQRQIVSNFANIPIDEIKGFRLPFLQLSGNNSYEAVRQSGLTYDCSWATVQYQPGLWPYTLDYKSTQDCYTSGPCPDASIPGVWVVPMINWLDQTNSMCSMVDSCNSPDTEDELLQFFIKNFNYEYEGNRAPFGFYVHATFFTEKPAAFNAYLRFIDYLLEKDDVYIVTSSTAIDWIKNPVSLKNGPLPANCLPNQPASCDLNTCHLMLGDDERWMTHCAGGCPAVYPWVGNPYGTA